MQGYYYTHMLGQPHLGNRFFGMQYDIPSLITHAKFYVNQFGSFGSPDTPKSVYLLRVGRSLLQQCKHSRGRL